MPLETLTRRLRTLGDPVRLRVLALLGREELTVSELVATLNCAQPRVSGHLARLHEEGLVKARRAGRSVHYRLDDGDHPLLRSALEDFRETEEARLDDAALDDVLKARPTAPPPGTIGRDYLPGRTWEGLARALLALMPAQRIADLGIGRGDLTLLLAESAERLVAIDHDAEKLRRAEERAHRAGIDHVEFREGTLEDPPIAPGEVDLWVLSQVLHLVDDPAAALAAAAAKLEPGGRVVVLDLLAHRETWVRERLDHRGLGFTESGLEKLLIDAGFADVRVSRVARDRKPPHFVTLLATGRTAS